MTRSSFFRREALEHQRDHGLGGIRLVRPLSLALLTGFAVAVALATASYLWWGEYTRKARVAGVLVPESGVIRLVSPGEAVVLERHAIEGRRVRKDELLFVLSFERTAVRGDAVQRSFERWQRSLDGSSERNAALLGAQADTIARRLADLAAERAQLDAEADLQRRRIALAEQALARLESLRGENFVSAAQVQAKAEELLGIQAQAQALDRQRSAHAREQASLEAQRRELPLQAQARQDEIDRERADVAQKAAESEARHRVEIRAPQDGVLSAVLAEPGQAVTPAVALASLVPAGAPLLAHLYAPSSAVGFLRAQQTVLLRYQAYPYQKFGHQRGRVLQVSLTPLQAAEQAALTGRTEAAVNAVEPMYRITVALDRQQVSAYGRPQPLVAGMQLDADVLLDRRRLVEWMFEPLLGIAGRV